MSSFWWITLAALLCVSLTEVKCETTAQNEIPNHLLECYMDPGIYHRDNRLPASFDYFLDLVRKVEASPTSRNINARELSMVLLHYLKQDGIQSLESYTKYLPNNILPFAPSGDENVKHRLTLWGLVPRVDHSYMAAVNESLTTKEMCNLHFMLSYSIDPYKRDDEKCPQGYDDNNRGPPERGSDWDSFQNIHGYYRRHKRTIEHPHPSNRVDLNKEQKDEVGQSLRKTEIQELEKILKKRIFESLKDDWKPMTKREVREHKEDLRNLQQLLRRTRRNSGGDKKAEVESVDPQHSHNQAASDHHPPKKLQSFMQFHDFGRYGGSFYPRTGHSMDDSTYTGVVPNIPLSECPVVNGVITTPYGSLTIGNVIAGIAAGLNPEDIPPTRLNVKPSELESPMDRVKNVWATTIAGVVADSITSLALLDVENVQILKGGWNETSTPKWYLLKANKIGHLAEVAIRGSLDGLFLGLNVKEWTNKFSNFKLSQILETYYNCYWGSVGAKYRVQLRPKYAPDDVFRKQVHLMSLVLKKQKTNHFTVLEFSNYAKTAVAKVIQHIENMDDREKSSIGAFMASNIYISVNFVAVVDSSWGYENLIKIFEKLRSAQVASTPNSNLTVICGNDGRILLTSQSSLELRLKFTREMLQENCTRGFNLPLVFDMLDVMYRKVYYDEKMSNRMNTDSLVLALIPYDPIYPENAEYSAEKSRNFRQIFPDVRLMVATSGRTETFLPLVKSPKDLFQISPLMFDEELKSVDIFIDGVKQSYQRLTRPSCGSYFDDQSPGTEVRVTKDVGPGNIVFYRLLPQYFYTVKGTATITIRSKQRAPLTVCHSREMDRPVGPLPRGQPDYNSHRDSYRPEYPPDNNFLDRQTDDDGPVQCKLITSETYKIELNNPCEGASNLEECRPLYISLSPPLQESVSIISPTSWLPTFSQYEITAEGLTCYNSAAAVVLSPLLLSSLILYFFSNSQIF